MSSVSPAEDNWELLAIQESSCVSFQTLGCKGLQGEEEQSSGKESLFTMLHDMPENAGTDAGKKMVMQLLH